MPYLQSQLLGRFVWNLRSLNVRQAKDRRPSVVLRAALRSTVRVRIPGHGGTVGDRWRVRMPEPPICDADMASGEWYPHQLAHSVTTQANRLVVTWNAAAEVRGRNQKELSALLGACPDTPDRSRRDSKL